jgi:tetratricopeptide (TPR) repeat protein
MATKTVQERIRCAKIHSEAEGYLELGLPKQALECLGRLGDPAAFEVRTLYLWGESLRAMDRYGDAISPLEKAANEAPEDTHVHMALGWCYKRTGRLDLAIATMEEALVVEPTEAVLHYNLACYLSLAGERRRALSSLAKAISLDPDFGELVDEESDFEPLRSDPEFQAICGRAKGLHDKPTA